ncbi:CCR4-NOT transcription complex subunit 6-like-B [Eufriesea mexicana]|uniref:CCR4-NOT transcription complex subunit 6-like-B n=1 Tax=Eufriesea mexicana TaxID=516756 RepID=A0A310S423_9HYME|nr:CCR4-NOT transcription complex subunit 6-like-B [Eufriesea mexicana]
MSGYTGSENYWGQSPQGQNNFDSFAFGQPNPQFEFQTYNDQQFAGYSSYSTKGYLGSTQSAFTGGATGFVDEEEEEPPLLEELGIDPNRILQKTLAVLNPFHRKRQIDDPNYLLQDSDLAGPVAFCLLLAVFLLLAGSKVHFGHIYGLAMTSCILMYILQSLMSSSNNITLSCVASILGYCLLPIVILAGVSIFISLRGTIGLVLAIIAVAWSMLSASRLLTTMSGEENQQLLIIYPCALLYGLPSDPAQVQQPILVCTAHIHWDPEFCDVKLIQTMMLSNELRSILDQAGQSFRPGHKPDSSNVQLLLCGDFNSLPDSGLPSDPAQVQQPILVCTAHIHWDPEFCDVKLIQTMMLSNELRSILDQAGQSFRPGHKPDSSNVQLLLCGDFNSLPDSGVIEFLTSGRVAADHRDFKDLAYKSCLQKISGCDKPNEFTHSFKLASAYSEDIMPYTNYTFEFKGIIDYIFYSKQSMVPLGLLGPLSADWFKEHKVVGCPHPHVPSDHFPLLVELEMTPTVGTSNGLISRR